MRSRWLDLLLIAGVWTLIAGGLIGIGAHRIVRAFDEDGE